MDSIQFTKEDMAERSNYRQVWHKTTTSVGLVTSRFQGKDNVMACEWAIPVSFRPVQFLIVIGKNKKTAELILESKEFGITFASDEQATLSHISGSYSGHDMEKFEFHNFPTREGKIINAPIILDGLLAVECKLAHTLDIGDRYVFVGEAVYAELWDDKSPLIYHAGKYYSLGTNIPKPKL